MTIQISQLPNNTDFNQSGLYGTYATLVKTNGYQTVTGQMFSVFLNKNFPELAQLNNFSNDKYLDAEYIFGSSAFGMDKYMGYLFKENVKNFFTEWLPQKNIPITTTGNIITAFTTFLGDSSRDLSTKKTSTIFFWAWSLLLKQLKQVQKTSLNKAKAALVYSYGEQAAVSQMSKIQFKQQSSDSDYATIKDNMDAQQQAESYRNWRSIIGKSTSLYQSDVQVANEARSQVSQLTSKMIQEIESIASAITKIG